VLDDYHLVTNERIQQGVTYFLEGLPAHVSLVLATCAEPLLTTRPFVPPPRPDHLSRPRLVSRLEEGMRLGRHLSLLSAPAGYGKTTVLSE